MKLYYSYENFRDDTKKLITKSSEFEADAIVTIARGGYTLTHALAEGLNIRDVQSIQTQLYDKDKKRDKLTLKANCILSTQKRVLVVDDISDSGETLEYVMGYLRENFQDIEFKSATLFYKKTSKFEPDFWIREAKEWIEFFWEKDFT